MQVELDARRRVVVFPFDGPAVGSHHVIGHEDVVVLVVVILDIAVDADVGAGLQFRFQAVVFFRRHGILAAELAAPALIADVEEFFGRNTVGAVGHLEGQEDALRFQFPELDFDDLALEDDVVLLFAEDVVDGNRLTAKGTAHPNPAVAAGLGAASLAFFGDAARGNGSALAGLLIVFILI